MDEVRAILSAEEPDPGELARLDASAVQHLLALAAAPGERLAVKAVLALSRAGGADTPAALARVATSRDPAVRAAAAFAVQRLPQTADTAQVLDPLLGDADLGVQKAALRAAAERPLPALRVRLEGLAAAAPEARLRGLAQAALARMPP
jgi:hypothetical protein